MVGDVINLAARLMGKAKGRIVCDEVTHDLVRTCATGRNYQFVHNFADFKTATWLPLMYALAQSKLKTRLLLS